MVINHYAQDLCLTPVTPSAADSTILGQVTDINGNPVAGVVINLNGTQNRKSITDANGQYQFDEVETTGFYTVTPSRIGYRFSPENRALSQLGNRTEAMFTAESTAVAGVNVIDTAEYFVRQHYLDFLGREPDEAGFNFWSDQILACGIDEPCREQKRVDVSAAYFLSIEFAGTGGFVDALYRASFGRRPLYQEFVPDAGLVGRGVVVNRAGWENQLATNQREFLEAWTQRAAFKSTFDVLNNSDYVDRLIANTGVSFESNERNALIGELNAGTMSRLDVLRRVAQDERFTAAKRNEMLVMMEYFGYLRRDPDESGFQFWLNKLDSFGGDFTRAEMVKAFITSDEYRARFR